ncbi:hypothetical protein [uncultured Roseovarius sp.]|uniref:hypothetical protein n=1 Tax=uncultured Roseovarius sp. TaxID=293344 RepID=UPI0026118C2F|nr:hypothetical protein [uncultured Roseovarius sp.]
MSAANQLIGFSGRTFMIILAKRQMIIDPIKIGIEASNIHFIFEKLIEWIGTEIAKLMSLAAAK